MIRITATGLLRTKIASHQSKTTAIGRRCLATSAQKRALSKNQLSGKDVGAKPPIKPASGGGSESTPASGGGGGGGLGIVMPVLGLTGGAVGGAYFMDLIPKEYLDMVGGVIGGQKEKKADAVPALVQKVEKVEKVVETPAPETTPVAVESSEKETKEPTEETSVVEKSDVEQIGGRVTQIIAPPKEEGRVITAPPPVEHAADAHKVTIENFAPTAQDNTEKTEPTSKPVQSITAATAMEAELELRPPKASADVDLELAKAHATLRANMDETLFKDLDSLSYSQLRIRVVQLAAELQERTKWEAVRLREFLAMKEKEAKERNLGSLQKQRLEFEALLAQRLREQEDRLSREANAALQAKEDSFQSVLDAATNAQEKAHELALQSATDRIQQEINAKAEADFGTKLAEEKAAFVQELEKKAGAIEELAGKLAKNDEILKISKSFEDGSQTAHKISAAALALAERLESRNSALEEVAALKAAANENGVIASALSKIPESIKVGVPTIPELQSSFDAVHSVGRQAAHVPAGRNGVEGQIAGMLFAKMTVAPSPDSPPPVGVDGNMADYTLASARRFVQLGDLEEAVRELDKLKGQTAFTMRDWKNNAMDRIAVEKAVKVIKMECALMNKNMAG